MILRQRNKTQGNMLGWMCDHSFLCRAGYHSRTCYWHLVICLPGYLKVPSTRYPGTGYRVREYRAISIIIIINNNFIIVRVTTLVCIQ